MINKSTLALAVLILSGNLWAGEIRMIEEALELSIDQVTLPVSSIGSISVRKCSACTPKRLPLSAKIEFRIGKEIASLSDFRAASRDSRAIHVFYDVKTGEVTRMALDMRHNLAGRSSR